MKIIAFIPARKGSKGIKNKNMALLNKRPLIYYTINIAKKIRNNVFPFVSTDSKKILRYCEKFGFKNKYLRPKSLSKSNSDLSDAIIHGINWLKKNYNLKFDAVLLLQPTTPIREVKKLKLFINQFKRKKLKSLISVTPIKEHPYECIKLFKNKWSYLVENPKKINRRQTYKKKFYFIDGAYYIAKINFLKKNKSFINKKYTKIFIHKREWPIDIDHPEDLLVASTFLKK